MVKSRIVEKSLCFYPAGKPIIPHLRCYQGFAVKNYSCDPDALDLEHPSKADLRPRLLQRWGLVPWQIIICGNDLITQNLLMHFFRHIHNASNLEASFLFNHINAGLAVTTATDENDFSLHIGAES